MAETDIIGIGIAYDTSQLLTGSRQVQDALRQVEQAEKSAQGATKALEQSSGQAAQAMAQESRASETAASSTQHLSQSSQQAARALHETAQAATQTAQAATDIGRSAGQATSALAAMAQQALAFGTAQVGIASVSQALTSMQQSLQAAVQSALRVEAVSAALKGITGSSQEAGRMLEFVRTTANRLGLEFGPLADGFQTISAAARGTVLEGTAAQEAFLAVAEAGRVFQLSSQDMQGALLALGQMISKGTVQAEELRGQLGERLPGAFQIAARAMGVSTAELGKMLEQGQVMTSDFLPKFAAQVRAELGGSVEEASKTAGAAMNRLANDMKQIQTAVGEFILPPIAAAVGAFQRLSSAALDAMKAMRLTADTAKQFEAAQAAAPGLAGTAERREEFTRIQERIRLLQQEQEMLKAGVPVVPSGTQDELNKLLERRTVLMKEQQTATDANTKAYKDLDDAYSSAARGPGATGMLDFLQKARDFQKKQREELEQYGRTMKEVYGRDPTAEERAKFLKGQAEDIEKWVKANEGMVRAFRDRPEVAGILGTGRQAEAAQKALDDADEARKAARKSDQEAAKQAREDERQRQADLDATMAKGKAIYEQDDDVVQLRADLQRRTEALMYTEEERFRLRVQQLAEEHPALQQILEDELARYDAAQRTNDALKERNKLLQDQASASKAQLDDINRIMGQLGPSRRTMTRAEQLQERYTSLTKVTSDEETLARARAQMQDTLSTEQWYEWRDAGLEALHDLASEFAQMAFHGKLSFTDLANHAVEQLFRIASESTFKALGNVNWAGLLQTGLNLIGLASGGATSGTLPTTWGDYMTQSAAGRFGGTRQHGGTALAGVPYWVGEAGPELVVPKQTSTVIPHGPSMALAAPTVNVYIQGVHNPNEWQPSQGAVHRGISQAVSAAYRAL